MKFFGQIKKERRESGNGGFTMIEIALSLAVVAFAMVAIMGVLPTGMTVQKENREDTLINQEGNYWLEAIRTGARGMNDLTNYVESVQVLPSSGPALQLTNLVNPTERLTPTELIAVLSTPKFRVQTKPFKVITNQVVARVKAITGIAAEKSFLTNESSFRYQLEVETIPDQTVAPDMLPPGKSISSQVSDNLYDVRVVIRWPVTQRGLGWSVGNNKKTFRAKIAGTRVPQTANITANVLTGIYTNYTLIVPNRF
jgi:type II secretory pathway pseudopilin PulG